MVNSLALPTRGRQDYDAEETATVVPIPIAVVTAIVAVVVSAMESATVVVAAMVVVSAMVAGVSLGGSCQTAKAGDGHRNC